MILALLVQAHCVPRGKVFHAEPIQGRLNVGQELPFLPGQVLGRLGGQVAGDAGIRLKEEMPQLVNECRSVGVFQQGNQVMLTAEHSAVCAALIQYAVVFGRECACIVGGGFDLVGMEGNHLFRFLIDNPVKTSIFQYASKSSGI